VAKEWFVILWQGEFEVMKTDVQKSVYEAIKSYCSNGKKTKALSIRDIQKRTHLSFGTVQAVIPQLIDLGMIKINGKEGRRGGLISVYEVISARSVKRSTSDQLEKSSDQPLKSSDQIVGVNVEQSKKEIENNFKKQNKQRDTKPVHEETKVPPEYADDIFKDSGWKRFKR